MCEINIPVFDKQNKRVGTAKLSAEKFAQSAIDNKIDFNSFVATMNIFSDHAYEMGDCEKAQIIEWREKAVEAYYKFGEKAGLIKLKR